MLLTGSGTGSDSQVHGTRPPRKCGAQTEVLGSRLTCLPVAAPSLYRYVSWAPAWLWTHYIAKDDLKFQIILLLLHKLWD